MRLTRYFPRSRVAQDALARDRRGGGRRAHACKTRGRKLTILNDSFPSLCRGRSSFSSSLPRPPSLYVRHRRHRFTSVTSGGSEDASLCKFECEFCAYVRHRLNITRLRCARVRAASPPRVDGTDGRAISRARARATASPVNTAIRARDVAASLDLDPLS